MTAAAPPNPVVEALADVRRRLASVAAISGAINLLMLSGSIYMLQVYDRVLPSRNVTTLVGLSILVIAAYLLQGCLDAIRSRMLAKISALFDAALQEPIYAALVSLPLKGAAPSMVQQPLRDLEQVRAFLAGMGPTAFLDMPWLPIFVLILFLFHPMIGLVAIIGATLIVLTTVIAERQSRIFARGVAKRGAQRAALADEIRRNAEVIHALGMRERFKSAWCRLNEAHIGEGIPMRDAEADIGATAKLLRYALQSAVLGVGAALVIAEKASGGIMIASSIIMGRALAPIEIVLGTWKQLTSARDAVKRLAGALNDMSPLPPPAVTLRSPANHLWVQHVAVVPPGSKRIIARDISFSLPAGSGLALLGASGSGKSSLAKTIVGLWQPLHGQVRLDGARLDQWDSDRLGRYIGYLPQEVCLFDGSVADNISRFEHGASEEWVLQAARVAGAHDLIVSLPEGYATQIGEGGALLSAGQRQRIGLARALYGSPFLVVLDEPNANLDAEGELALAGAIKHVRQRRAIVIVISHRLSALSELDMVLVLHRGGLLEFGRRDEVSARLRGRIANGARSAGKAPSHRSRSPEGKLA
jgi:PrtD family type I secretion system ABC transporter